MKTHILVKTLIIFLLISLFISAAAASTQVITDGTFTSGTTYWDTFTHVYDSGTDTANIIFVDNSVRYELMAAHKSYAAGQPVYGWVSQYVDLRGVSTITFSARYQSGSLHNPSMQVYINGNLLGSIKLSSTSYQTYTINVPTNLQTTGTLYIYETIYVDDTYDRTSIVYLDDVSAFALTTPVTVSSVSSSDNLPEVNHLITATAPYSGGDAPSAGYSYIMFDWGDNSGSPVHTGTSPATYNHIYSSPGTYTITAYGFTNINGKYTETASKTTSITVTPIAPVVSFTGTPTSLSPGSSVAFTGQITLSTGDSLSQYKWDFGDGTSDTTYINPTHTYSNAGTYTVSLTATSTYGQITTYTRTNYITVANQYITFNESAYDAGDTANITWNLLGMDFGSHSYSLRVFGVNDLGQITSSISPETITTSSGHLEYDTTGWSGDYVAYVYQESNPFTTSITGYTSVTGYNSLTVSITNNGAIWTQLTNITITAGSSTIANNQTTTGSATFSLESGTYIITAATEGKTSISTSVEMNAATSITLDWVTGTSSGTTSGAGSAYASTFITFRVMDATYGLPLSGVTISTQGVSATNPVEWFGNLFGAAWGSNILGTNQSGITDDNGIITFAMFQGVRYTLTISYAELDEDIIQTFTPSSLSTEYPIYLDIIDPITSDASIGVLTTATAEMSGVVTIVYDDSSLSTSSQQMQIFEKGLDGNYTLIEEASFYGNTANKIFNLTNFEGTSIKIVITAETGQFGHIERIYYHTFPGPMVALGGLPASCYIWICLISAVLLAGVATFVSSYATCFIICFVEWAYWFFGWFFEIGAIPAATLLTIATVMSVAIYIGSRR